MEDTRLPNADVSFFVSCPFVGVIAVNRSALRSRLCILKHPAPASDRAPPQATEPEQQSAEDPYHTRLWLWHPAQSSSGRGLASSYCINHL